MSAPGSRLLRSTAAVGFWTAVSRSLGFVREVLMAVFFGTSLAKSAFDVAFTIPNLFRRLFGEGALSAAFVPVMTRTLARDGVGEVNRLISRMMTLLAVTLAVLVGGGLLLITGLLNADLELGERAAAVLPLLRIMLPYMFFICLVALCMSILNAFHHFVVPAATPVLLNVVWILVLLYISPLFGTQPSERIVGVAYGILAAGGVQLAVQLPVLLKYGVRIRPDFGWRDAHVRKVLLLMGPAALGMGIHQVNVCIDRVLALWAAEWAPAALTFSERLLYLPLGVFATALGTVLLPTFSRQAFTEGHERIGRTLSSAAGNLMLVMIPSAVGLGVLALPIVNLAFQWQGGAFDADSAFLTARALRFYAPGLVVFSLYKMLVPAFYALHDTRTPVRVGVAVVGLNLVLNVLFVLTWPLEYKHAGLACATVLSSLVNSIVLARILRGRLGRIDWRPVAVVSAKALLASAVMAACAVWVWASVLNTARNAGLVGKWADLAGVGAAIGAGVAVYLALAAALCPAKVHTVWRGLRRFP